MLTGTLDPVSNKATWVVLYELVDADTDEAIDLSDVDEITVQIRDPGSSSSRLSATKTGGDVTITDTGVFRFVFSADDMAGLDPRTYEIGVTLEQDDEVVQLMIGHLPILDGIVS